MSKDIGRYRSAKDVKPGWHIRMLDDSDQPEWLEVSMTMRTTNIFTDQKLVRVIFKGGGTAVCEPSDDVMTRTIPEVRRAAEGG